MSVAAESAWVYLAAFLKVTGHTILAMGIS